ncbi:10584_t:CDS:2, partial [Dentiscutata heterogama]
DMVPTTFVGKVIAFPAMMCGILLIALPSIIVGKNFTLVWEAMRQYRRSNANTRDQAGNVGTNNEGEYTGGTDLRTSFESTHSYISNMPRGYDSMNDELVANQDALLEQVRTLLKISQQNQVALERIQQTLEQNGMKVNPEKNSPKITIPEKGTTSGTS